METTEPSLDHNLDMFKFLNLDNLSYAAVEYFNVTLLQMLKEGLNVDVTINANGGSVKAHKAVLMSVSPVFKTMFMHPTQEHLTSTVDLPDISFRGLQLFLVLVYILKDNIAAPQEFNEPINEHFNELWGACRKHQVRRLWPTLAANLKLHLTPDNCWDYLHQRQDVCPSHPPRACECSDYIWNHTEEVIESESFVSEMKTHSRTARNFVRNLLQKSRPSRLTTSATGVHYKFIRKSQHRLHRNE